MERLSIDEVRRDFDDVVNLVAEGRQRVVIRETDEGGRDRAALIPIEDLALLEEMDGERDVAVEELDAFDVRRHLEEDLGEVASRAERIVLRRAGIRCAALVPERDLARLEEIDARIDLEAAKRILKRQIEDERP